MKVNRDAVLVVAGHARDAEDLRLLLDALGLLPQQPRRRRGAPAAAGHGRVRAYRRGCRCDECRAAATAADRKYRDRARERMRTDPEYAAKVPHGRASTYGRYGCRCMECRAAATVARRRERRRNRGRISPSSASAMAPAGGEARA